MKAKSHEKLTDYFQSQQATNEALDRYKRFAQDRQWYVNGNGGKLHLYSLAEYAFNPATSESDALKAFSKVYETIGKWPGVQRGGSLAPVEQVLEAILLHESGFARRENYNLANLALSASEAKSLQQFLTRLKFIKPTQAYPWMPASKVLHFVNPSLFPIWDWDVLWYKVMWKENGREGRQGAFSQEYKAFCASHGFNRTENSAVFLSNYTLWAASYIREADTGFMYWFAEWMSQHFLNDLKKYNMEEKTTTLFAAAFEFVAIGAAYLKIDND